MMVFWNAGFVLLTLAINAPMLPYVLRVTGLSKVRQADLLAPDVTSDCECGLQDKRLEILEASNVLPCVLLSQCIALCDSQQPLHRSCVIAAS